MVVKGIQNTMCLVPEFVLKVVLLCCIIGKGSHVRSILVALILPPARAIDYYCGNKNIDTHTHAYDGAKQTKRQTMASRFRKERKK